MLPARSLALIAPTGGDQMEMGVVLPIAAMRMEHHHRAPSEGCASDCAREIIQTLHPTAHVRTQHDRRVLVKGRAEQRRDRQDDVPIDHPLVEDLAHLADLGIDVDFGTPQAQG